MRLVSCHIENFGKLKDFTYCFDDDLSVIFAENGWGKSTLAAFLKVMFYGFDGENRRNEEGNERLRYKPWGGGVYGGSLIWSCGTKTYRMLRTFGERRAGDTFALYDEETGLSSGDFTAQTGEELFGIDRDSFRRTVFWSQSDHETFSTTSIQSKIGDLSAQQSDLPAYDAAVKRLEKEAQRLSPDRAGGLIRKKEDRLKVLKADEVRLPLLASQHRDCADREKALSEELSSIRAQRRQYLIRAAAPAPSPSGQTRSSGPIQKEQLAAAQKKRAALTEENRAIRRRGQQARREYVRLKKELRQAYLEKTRRQKKRRAGAAASLILSAMVALLCIKSILPMYFLLLGVLLALYGLTIFWQFIRRGGRIPEAENLQRLLNETGRRSQSLSFLKSELHRTERALAENRALCESLQRKTEAGSDAQPSASNAHNSGVAAVQLSARAAQTLSAFDGQEEACRAELLHIRQQAADLQEMIRECEASSAQIPALESEIRALRDQYATCVRTLSYLEEAKNRFTSRYMNPFLRSFSRYYSMLTGETADNIRTDADFSITVMDAGLPRDPSLMSEGTRDLIGLCRRMAMIDAMYPGEKPFLVLDDPFANLDDERVKGGLRFLHSTSLEYQILYLTCHKSRF